MYKVGVWNAFQIPLIPSSSCKKNVKNVCIKMYQMYLSKKISCQKELPWLDVSYGSLIMVVALVLFFLIIFVASEAISFEKNP